MAIIGRASCLWCGFNAAHVKQTEGKLPYHYCPECGTLTQARNGNQAGLLMARMRADGALPEPPATDDPIIVPGPAPKPADPPAPTKRAGLFEQLAGKGKP